MGPGMEALKKDNLPGDLLPLLEAVGLDGTVAVQARQTLEETRWLLELADEYPFIKGVVGWVDLRSLQLREQLDRLARSVQDLWKLVEALDATDVHLRILDIGIDTSAPTGRLILTVLGGISQFEREIMLERQREGIARAKAVGKYKGRKPTARQKARDVPTAVQA